ncbi:MAG: DUF4864 domain-containing protein [Betaproteobacteria bacterium]
MRYVVPIVAVAASLATAGATAQPHAPPAQARDEASVAKGEWTSIRETIRAQLAALRRHDAAQAFSFAASGIRSHFGDAATFLAMVEQQYGALLTARYTEFLEGAVIDGHTIQPLRLVMSDDTVLVALYEMQRDGDAWKIVGCAIAPSTVRST